MSDIVEMTSTVGGYHSGTTYRVRSRNAQELQDNDQANIIEDQSVADLAAVSTDVIEGV